MPEPRVELRRVVSALKPKVADSGCTVLVYCQGGQYGGARIVSEAD